MGWDIICQSSQEPQPPVPQHDPFLQDIINWTGSQVVAANTYLNFFSLSGIALEPNGTVGLTLGSGVIKFPPLTKWSGVVFSTRIVGTVSGGPSADPRDWRIQTRRPDGTTIVGSASDVKISGSDITNRDAALMSYTRLTTDPFSVDGIQVGLFNTMTQNTITLTSVSLRIQRIVNPV